MDQQQTEYVSQFKGKKKLFEIQCNSYLNVMMMILCLLTFAAENSLSLSYSYFYTTTATDFDCVFFFQIQRERLPDGV